MNSSDFDAEKIIVVVRYQGKINWYRSDRDIWVLDVHKWRNEFLSYGYEVPEFNEKYRFGILVIDQSTAQQFLDKISDDRIDKQELSFDLVKRYSSAKSWWDVMDLFPIMFVDFDNHHVGAFYHEGVPMERYIPDGWTGEFIDFANDYPEEVFPKEDKFWIKGDADLLKLLNERGATV
jgi:hypothetical protein